MLHVLPHSFPTRRASDLQHNADLTTHAAEHDDRENDRRLDEGEALRADESLAGGEERSGQACEHRADGESRQLRIRWIDSKSATSDLVLTQRQIGRAHVRTPATITHIVCRLQLQT